MRHILQQEGTYQLNTRERYRTGIGRFIEYSIGMRNMVFYFDHVSMQMIQ